MRGPHDPGPPRPLDPIHWTPARFLRQHAARSARRRRVRRSVLWLVAAGVGFGFVVADGGLLSILRQRARIRALQSEVSQLEAQHRALAREVELRRDDPATIERLAREEYGMIYAGEKVVRIFEVSEAQARRMEARQSLGSGPEPPEWHLGDARADSSRTEGARARRARDVVQP